jgi:hypothetical protein
MCLFFTGSATTVLKKKRKRVWSPDGSLDVAPPAYASPTYSTTTLNTNQPVNPPSYRFSQGSTVHSVQQVLQQQPTSPRSQILTPPPRYQEVIRPDLIAYNSDSEGPRPRPRARSRRSDDRQRRASVPVPLRQSTSEPWIGRDLETQEPRENSRRDRGLFATSTTNADRRSRPVTDSVVQQRARPMQSTSNLVELDGRARRRSSANITELEGSPVPNFDYERMSLRFNQMIEEGDSDFYRDPSGSAQPESSQRADGPLVSTRNLFRTAGSGSAQNNGSMSKVWNYSNSRLPPLLPPLKVYLPTWPLFCLAAKHSLRVYDTPTGKERAEHIKASLFSRTKAMTLKSLPLDDMNTIVFAIRGTVSILDWAVNFRLAPVSPEGFLDDPGNLCHAVSIIPVHLCFS